MKLTAIVVLLAAALMLMVYPFWGLLHPESYEPILLAEFGMAEGVAPDLVQRSAAMNWAPNGILASSFVCLAGFVANPARLIHAHWAGGCLIVYPFVYAIFEAWSGYNLTSRSSDAEFTLFLGGKQLVYIAFGMAVLGIASGIPRPETLER